MFIHGFGQGIGLVGNFFPVEFQVNSLHLNQSHKLDFQAMLQESDEITGCNSETNENAYYECARDFIKTTIENEIECYVPILDSIFLRGYFLNTHLLDIS